MIEMAGEEDIKPTSKMSLSFGGTSMQRGKKKKAVRKEDIRYSLVSTQLEGWISSYLAYEITLSLKHKVYSFKKMCKAALVGKQMFGYDFCETQTSLE